jgi:hypothetical protein
MPGPLELGESTNKRREAGFMVFTIKPCLVSSLQRSFHGEVKEAVATVSFETDAPDNLLIIGTWLVFQEKNSS